MSNQSRLYHKNLQGKLILTCPGCREELEAADVEAYPRCPFCNRALPSDDLLEDFILDPVISGWVRKNFNSIG